MKNSDRHALNVICHPLNVGGLGRIIVRPDTFAAGWSWTNLTGQTLRVVLVTPGEIHLEPCSAPSPLDGYEEAAALLQDLVSGRVSFPESAGSGDLAAPGESVTLAEEDVNAD